MTIVDSKLTHNKKYMVPALDFTPVDVSGLGLTAEPGATFSLLPSAQVDTRLLTDLDICSKVTDDGTATFNLTPTVEGDTMTFNLTPVVPQNLTPVVRQQQPSTPAQYPSSQLELNFTRELDSGGVDPQHVIAFSPPLNISSSGSLTPDFTGLLPPPPPQGMKTGTSASKPLAQPGQERPASYPPNTTSQFSPTSLGSTVFSPTTLATAPPAFLEPFFGKPASQPLNLSPPPTSQLSLLLQSPRHSPPQYAPPPPPYKSPTYPPSGLLLGTQPFSSDVLRIAPSVTLTKKPRSSTDARSTPATSQPSVSPVYSQKMPTSQILLHSAPPPQPGALSKPAHPSTSPSSSIQMISSVSPAPHQSPSSKSSSSQIAALQNPHSMAITGVQQLLAMSHAPVMGPIQTSPRPSKSQVSPKASPQKHQRSPSHQKPSTSPVASSHLSPSSQFLGQKSPPFTQVNSGVGYHSDPSLKVPSFTLEDLKDLPGVNLKKNTVDLNTYVTAVARNMHPNFANVDSYAERCLACIVRKIRSNLPTLKALEMITRSSRMSITDPGCILVPRMKDGRITIARPGGGAGGTKKIHPHLALVQIFKNPSVTNHNLLMNTDACSSPFQGEGDLVCISPLHYFVEEKRSKPPVVVKKRIQPSDSFDIQGSNMGEPVIAPVQSHYQPVPPVAKQTLSSDDGADLLSDESDDDTDWVEKWNTESVAPASSGINEFKEEEILRQIQLLCLKTDAGGGREYIKADDSIVREMNVKEDLMMLLKGKYNLEGLKDAVRPKKTPVAKSSAPAAKAKRPYNRKVVAKSVKKKNPMEAWVSEPLGGGQIKSSEQHSTVKPIATPEAVPVKTDEDETVIQSLLDDIKGSFEDQFEMDLDPFGNTVGPSFASQDFGMTSSFNLGNFDEDSFSSSGPSSREMFQQSVQSQQSGGVASVSSDAMFSGVGGMVEDPATEPVWSSTDQDFGQQEYLSGGDSMSQDQFLKMFDDN